MSRAPAAYHAVRATYLHERQTQGVRTSLHIAARAHGLEFAAAARLLGFTEAFIAASAQYIVATLPPPPERRS